MPLATVDPENSNTVVVGTAADDLVPITITPPAVLPGGSETTVTFRVDAAEDNTVTPNIDEVMGADIDIKATAMGMYTVEVAVDEAEGEGDITILAPALHGVMAEADPATVGTRTELDITFVTETELKPGETIQVVLDNAFTLSDDMDGTDVTITANRTSQTRTGTVRRRVDVMAEGITVDEVGVDTTDMTAPTLMMGGTGYQLVTIGVPDMFDTEASPEPEDMILAGSRVTVTFSGDTDEGITNPDTAATYKVKATTSVIQAQGSSAPTDNRVYATDLTIMEMAEVPMVPPTGVEVSVDPANAGSATRLTVQFHHRV